jgi:hypothetical protein
MFTFRRNALPHFSELRPEWWKYVHDDILCALPRIDPEDVDSAFLS